MVTLFTYKGEFQFGTLAELSDSEINLLREVCISTRGRLLLFGLATQAGGMERIARFATGDTEDTEIASRILTLSARMVGFGVQRGIHALPLDLGVEDGKVVVTSRHKVVSLD